MMSCNNIFNFPLLQTYKVTDDHENFRIIDFAYIKLNYEIKKLISMYRA